MNYAELSMAISEWLNRDQIDKVIPTIIRFGQRDLEDNLRIRPMEYHPATAAINAATASVALPSDFLEMLYIQLIKDNVRYPLRMRIPPASLYAIFQDVTETGTPEVVSRIADDLYFDVLTDSIYTRDWVYYRRLPVLVAAAPNNTNWWSEHAEEALLMSCLNKAGLYVTGISDGDKRKWKDAAKDSLNLLKLRGYRETTGGQVMRSSAWTL